MGGNREMMLTTFERRQAHVAPRLARHAIAQFLERSREIGPTEIPRQSHAAITSSRT